MSLFSPTRVTTASLLEARPIAGALAASASSTMHAAVSPRKAVVVQSGARDAYQLALALSEAGLLEALVTDLFWPSDRRWARALMRWLPSRIRALLTQRSEPRLPSCQVKRLRFTGLLTLLFDRLPFVSHRLRRRQTRLADAALGRAAGRLARRRSTALISYSYYGYNAFQSYGKPGTLFQLHPHPASMRRLLADELAKHPECGASLRQEWELSLPEASFQHLVHETRMASGFLAASSFTRATLVEHGADPERIRVVPYGVDATRFCPDPARSPAEHQPLELLFVGRINQRKGIKYLLEALRLLGTQQVHLTVCGRVVDSLEIFRPFAAQVTIRPSVSSEELVRAYQSADLFVFPSVAEGFGQVLLESLACGLPVLATSRTAAPDLITDGEQGCLVEPCSSSAVAERLEWALSHRHELAAMRQRARARAEFFSWERFRAGVVAAMQSLEPADTRETTLPGAARNEALWGAQHV